MWYAVTVYATHEERVKSALLTKASQRKLSDSFGEILVPTTVQGEKTKAAFPGYLLVEMEMKPATAALVKSLERVTGFVGKTPLPLPSREIQKLRSQVLPADPISARVSVGDAVKVTVGAFANLTGKVEGMSPDGQKLSVLVNVFGRDTPVRLAANQIEPAV